MIHDQNLYYDYRTNEEYLNSSDYQKYDIPIKYLFPIVDKEFNGIRVVGTVVVTL